MSSSFALLLKTNFAYTKKISRRLNWEVMLWKSLTFHAICIRSQMEFVRNSALILDVKLNQSE